MATDKPRRRRAPATAEPVQPVPLPPPDTTTVICARCGGHYIDAPIGRDAHKAVFGHQPAPPDPSPPGTEVG